MSLTHGACPGFGDRQCRRACGSLAMSEQKREERLSDGSSGRLDVAGYQRAGTIDASGEGRSRLRERLRR